VSRLAKTYLESLYLRTAWNSSIRSVNPKTVSAWTRGGFPFGIIRGVTFCYVSFARLRIVSDCDFEFVRQSSRVLLFMRQAAERHFTVNKPNEPKTKPPVDENEAVSLTLYSLGGVVLILLAIYAMTL
jgi:hypothetical protein